MIKITKSERVQDGVERLEYVAGEAAISRIEKEESILLEAAYILKTPPEKLNATLDRAIGESERARTISKQLAKRLAELMANEIPKQSVDLANGIKFYKSVLEPGLDFEYHKVVGDKLSRAISNLVYVGIFEEETAKTRIVVFCGEEAQRRGAKAGEIVREIAKMLGGSGGGDPRFAQGGVDGIPNSIPNLETIVSNRVSS